MKNEKNCCKRDMTEVDKAIHMLAHMIDCLAERVETIEGYIYDEDDDEDFDIEETEQRIERDEAALHNLCGGDTDEGWISVKDELPDEFDEYLVTVERTVKDDGKEYEHRYVTIAQYNPKRCEWSEKNVIAWQELVYAYEGE